MRAAELGKEPGTEREEADNGSRRKLAITLPGAGSREVCSEEER